MQDITFEPTKNKGNKHMAKAASAKIRPMNVHVAPGSSTEKAFRVLAGLPGQAAQLRGACFRHPPSFSWRQNNPHSGN